MANPPVCRVMDYGKYKYEAAQQARESRRRSSAIAIKEMKYRPKIGVGDFTTKTRQVEKFLGQGHKVKVTIMFRGREMQHPELGGRILDRVAEAVTHVGKVEMMPKLDGRNMVMVLAPDKKAKAAHDKARAEQATTADGQNSSPSTPAARPQPTPAPPAAAPPPVSGEAPPEATEAAPTEAAPATEQPTTTAGGDAA